MNDRHTLTLTTAQLAICTVYCCTQTAQEYEREFSNFYLIKFHYMQKCNILKTASFKNQSWCLKTQLNKHTNTHKSTKSHTPKHTLTHPERHTRPHTHTQKKSHTPTYTHPSTKNFVTSCIIPDTTSGHL